MNVRKICLMVASILTGVSVFLPFYSIQLNGETVEDGAISLMPSFYGIAIVVAAILIIGFALVGLKKGYIITSIVGVGVSLYACFNTMINKESAVAVMRATGKFLEAFDSTQNYNYEIVDGPGFFMLIFSALILLVMMFWNLGNREDY